ncbi:hypothetical protein QQS21_002135 [Conoideocrella luteorostrata]|uniref:Major facilitator superfamily (MFS) profile domain-containing protein n=1 Tax=Conoideocrella luteorostrata TaxID=1105319 RepID=A0AAJ0CYC5_9HYPO|nr:hypothetical protein QQS21_002135 [Conoideocrella luteorostrata]
MLEPERPSSRLTTVLQHLGLLAVYRSSLDIKLLLLQRLARLFAYGTTALILVSHLQALGHSRAQSGLFMTLTLVGDTLISFILTLTADKVGRRNILALGAILMSISGIIFAIFESYWLLLAAAILGVISPNGNEIGPFRAVEESIVAHLTDPLSRSDIYAWYSLVGTIGAAFGMMGCGWGTHILVKIGWELGDAYRAVFVGYAVLGGVKLLLTLALSRAVEAEDKLKATSETAALLESEREEVQIKQRNRLRALMPRISADSKGIAATLCLLFGLDAFASGLVPLSWLTFYFRSRFDVEEGRLGSIFFTTSIVAAASVIVASSISKRFGNVKTMVFTHLPSSVFLTLIPLPSSVYLSLALLILRACTQSMDVAPRSAFLAAILLPSERTAVLGLVNVVKTAAQSMGPLITGVLANNGLFWVSFVCAGTLKICYDLGLLAVFKNHEHQRELLRDEEQ